MSMGLIARGLGRVSKALTRSGRSAARMSQARQRGQFFLGNSVADAEDVTAAGRAAGFGAAGRQARTDRYFDSVFASSDDVASAGRAAGFGTATRQGRTAGFGEASQRARTARSAGNAVNEATDEVAETAAKAAEEAGAAGAAANRGLLGKLFTNERGNFSPVRAALTADAGYIGFDVLEEPIGNAVNSAKGAVGALPWDKTEAAQFFRQREQQLMLESRLKRLKEAQSAQLEMLAKHYPREFAAISAGEQLLDGDVPVGGMPRTDLLNRASMDLVQGEGGFEQPSDPERRLMSLHNL